MVHAMVHVQRVPQSRSMQVFGFNSSNTSLQLLELYFENTKKSGGGEVESLEDCDDYAIVTFKDKQSKETIVMICSYSQNISILPLSHSCSPRKDSQ